MKNETTRLAFGAIIRARRIKLGFTQEAVAAAVGWTAAEMVSLVETGHRSPSLDRIPTIARKLEMDAAELCRIALAENCPVFYLTLFPEPAEQRHRLENLQNAPELG
jgi:transcriptional regulator with XRE-family HTH domain